LREKVSVERERYINWKMKVWPCGSFILDLSLYRYFWLIEIKEATNNFDNVYFLFFKDNMFLDLCSSCSCST